VLVASDDIGGLQRTNVSSSGLWWHFVPWLQPDCDASGSSCQVESTLSYTAGTGLASPFPAQEAPLAHLRAWAFGSQPQLCRFGVTRSGGAVGDCPVPEDGRTLYWDVPLIRGTAQTEVRVKRTQALQWQPVRRVPAGTAGAACFEEDAASGSTATVCYDPAYAGATAGTLKALGAYLHAMGDRLSHHHCSDGAYIARRWLGEGMPENPDASHFLYYPDICGTAAHAMFHYPETGAGALPERSQQMIELSHQDIRQWVGLHYAGRLAVVPRAGYPDPATAGVPEIVAMIGRALAEGPAASRLSALCRIARDGYGIDWHDDNPTCSYPTDPAQPTPRATATLFALDAGTARDKRVFARVIPAAADTGRVGSIYVAALIPVWGWYFLTPSGFVAWNGGDMPALATGILQDTAFQVLDGSLDVSEYIGTDVYLGYGTSADEMLAARRYVKASTIQGTPRRR
jgi:hypothetical protein